MESNAAIDEATLNLAQQIVVSFLNDTENKSENYQFYRGMKLGDFAIESLELFEMIMKLEEVLGVEIDDSVIDSELHIDDLIAKLISSDS